MVRARCLLAAVEHEAIMVEKLAAMFPKASSRSPAMFDSPFWDRLSRTPPQLVPLLYLPIVCVLLWYGVTRAEIAPRAATLLFIAGMCSWSLAEYWLHRKLFHWQPSSGWGKRLHFLIHGVHHRWPRDPFRLVIPLPASISLFWLFLGSFYAAMNEHAWPFHAGFVTGYVAYDMTHYYIHHHRPRWKWLKSLRRHHLIHHAPRMEEKKYGVSTTLWDHVFRTY